jgi:type II secretory pathway pseudopilin PulG
MIVIAILAIIAIPNVLEARKSGNESSAIGSLRTLVAAQELFHHANGRFASLGELAAAGLIDPELGSGMNHGYLFETPIVIGSVWNGTATPAAPGKSGDLSFFRTRPVSFAPSSAPRPPLLPLPSTPSHCCLRTRRTAAPPAGPAAPAPCG